MKFFFTLRMQQFAKNTVLCYDNFLYMNYLTPICHNLSHLFQMINKRRISHLVVYMNTDESEIIRYTLYGYIGTRLSGIDMKIRQKTAYNKLSFLNNEQFGNLVKDVKIEINRRVLGIKLTEIENKKLAELNEVKFKDLVIDVFLMFNKRVPSKKYSDMDEPDLLLFNFENLINSLKNDQSVILKKMRETESFFEKMEYYQQFVEKLVEKNVETSLIDEHMEIVQEINNILTKKEDILMNFFTEDGLIQEVSQNLLSDNPYFLQIRERVYNLNNEKDQSEKNKTILDVLELILFKTSYNYEIEETIELLSSVHNSRKDIRDKSDSDNRNISQEKQNTYDLKEKNFDSVFQQKLYQLIEGIKRHAERINDVDKIQQLDRFLDPSVQIRKEEKILQLAHILKEIIIKDRNCHVKNEMK